MFWVLMVAQVLASMFMFHSHMSMRAARDEAIKYRAMSIFQSSRAKDLLEKKDKSIPMRRVVPPELIEFCLEYEDEGYLGDAIIKAGCADVLRHEGIHRS